MSFGITGGQDPQYVLRMYMQQNGCNQAQAKSELEALYGAPQQGGSQVSSYQDVSIFNGIGNEPTNSGITMNQDFDWSQLPDFGNGNMQIMPAPMPKYPGGDDIQKIPLPGMGGDIMPNFPGGGDFQPMPVPMPKYPGGSDIQPIPLPGMGGDIMPNSPNGDNNIQKMPFPRIGGDIMPNFPNGGDNIQKMPLPGVGGGIIPNFPKLGGDDNIKAVPLPDYGNGDYKIGNLPIDLGIQQPQGTPPTNNNFFELY